MAEPEDLLIDAARHTTVFVRDLWRRSRSPADDDATTPLAALAPRLDLLLTAYCGASLTLKTAQAPARPTMLERIFRRDQFPRQRDPVPATDGVSVWLPAHLPVGERGSVDVERDAALYRAMALLQAQLAVRGSVRLLDATRDPLLRDAALVLEVQAAQAEVARALPGMVAALERLRRLALERRPAVRTFVAVRRPLEELARAVLGGVVDERAPLPASPQQSLERARRLVARWALEPGARGRLGSTPLFRDLCFGQLRPSESATHERVVMPAAEEADGRGPRSARMQRRPEPREAAKEDDDDDGPGAWMVQQDAPHEVAEDPFGLQRPFDRDEETSADELGDMVSELAAARMVRAPGRSREVLLSDDPPASAVEVRFTAVQRDDVMHRYPEWDAARAAYHDPGSTVRELAAVSGSSSWVDTTLARHRALVAGVRRQFESLRAEPLRLHRQLDGDDVDLDACVRRRADLRAGAAGSDALYERRRRERRQLATLLLVDASGSTDGYLGQQRRVIDVEKEALLLVCSALEGVGEPYAVISFSGEGPHGVCVRSLKSFRERYGAQVALRIAGLEPERYTRAGAALRHATATLLREPAAHRLLLLLSDGRPNDADQYDGRYGVEDTRQAVIEARAQGISPFCLTIDHQAPRYLPRVFGTNAYALLPAPEQLPTALLDWIRRLIAR